MPTSSSIWSNEPEYRMIASQDKHLWSLFKWGGGTELYSSHEKYFIQAKINRFSWNCPLSCGKFTQGALQFQRTGQKSLSLQKPTIQWAKNSQKIHNTFSILLQYVAWTQWIIRSALTFEWMATYQSRYLRSSLAPLHLLAMHCKSRSMYQNHHYHQDEHHPLHPDHHHQNKNYLHNCFVHCFAIFNAIIRIITDIIAICIDIN